MLFASVAQAQITVSLGGYTEFFAGFYDNDQPGRTNREFELETEIVVRADGKADNGLLYGAKIELQNSTGGAGATGVGTDEASVYLGGTWGRLELGDFDGAADTLKIYAPLVGIEQIDGDYTDFAPNRPAFGIHIPNSGRCHQGHVPDAAIRGLPGRRQLHAGKRQRGAERRRVQEHQWLQGLDRRRRQLYRRILRLLRRSRRHRLQRHRQERHVTSTGSPFPPLRGKTSRRGTSAPRSASAVSCSAAAMSMPTTSTYRPASPVATSRSGMPA